MNLKFINPQNLGSLLMKSSQSNSNLRSPGFCLVRSYLITTVHKSTLRYLISAETRKTHDSNKRVGVFTYYDVMNNKREIAGNL